MGGGRVDDDVADLVDEFFGGGMGLVLGPAGEAGRDG